MYVLDTNTVSDLFRGNSKVLTRVRAVPTDRRVVTTVVSRIEILEGRFASVIKAADGAELIAAAARLIREEEQLSTFDILALGSHVAIEFDRLRANKKLKKIGREDLLIACFALAHRATLVTRNLKDFKLVPGLAVENWAD